MILNSLSRLFGRIRAPAVAVVALGARRARSAPPPATTRSPPRSDHVGPDRQLHRVRASRRRRSNVPGRVQHRRSSVPLRLEPTRTASTSSFDIDDGGQGRRSFRFACVGGAVDVPTRASGSSGSTGPFDERDARARRGLRSDSTLVAARRRGALVELQTQRLRVPVVAARSTRSCQSKASIRSSRTIVFRITFDPNCGFRSFLPGIPEELIDPPSAASPIARRPCIMHDPRVFREQVELLRDAHASSRQARRPRAGARPRRGARARAPHGHPGGRGAQGGAQRQLRRKSRGARRPARTPTTLIARAARSARRSPRLEARARRGASRSCATSCSSCPNITLADVPEGGEEPTRSCARGATPRADATALRPHWEIGEAARHPRPAARREDQRARASSSSAGSARASCAR